MAEAEHSPVSTAGSQAHADQIFVSGLTISNTPKHLTHAGPGVAEAEHSPVSTAGSQAHVEGSPGQALRPQGHCLGSCQCCHGAGELPSPSFANQVESFI